MWRVNFKVIRENKDEPVPAHQDFKNKEDAEEAYRQFLENEYLVDIKTPNNKIDNN